MWIFTQTCFLSVVAYDPNRDGVGVSLPADAGTDDLLLVRARVQEDILGLLEAIQLPGSRAVSSPAADYAWRTVLTRGELNEFLSLEVERLDYGNFKARVQARSGSLRHDVYMRVWSAMRGLRDRAA